MVSQWSEELGTKSVVISGHGDAKFSVGLGAGAGRDGLVARHRVLNYRRYSRWRRRGRWRAADPVENMSESEHESESSGDEGAVAQRLFFLAAGGWVLRDLPLPAPEVTSFSWLGPACTASAWVKRGLACQPVNRSRPRQSNITVARARRQRLVAWRRAARTPTRLAPPPPCSPAPRKRLGGGMGLD